MWPATLRGAALAGLAVVAVIHHCKRAVIIKKGGSNMPGLTQEIVRTVLDRAPILGEMPPVRMAAISLGYSFVELENGRMGICFTPKTAAKSCAHYSQAGGLWKKSILELAALMLSDHPLEKSVGIAAVNALSQMIMDAEPEKRRFSEKNFLDLAPQGEGRRKAGMLGNIGPFIPMLRKRYPELVVVDDNPRLEPGVQSGGYTLSRDVDDLADADVLIISGSSAVVGGCGRVIASARKAEFIGIVGPSAGWIPDPAFKKGVHAVAGTRIVDVESVRHAILEGGGTPNFSKFGKKYTLVPLSETR